MRSNNTNADEVSGLLCRRAKLALALILPILLALTGCPTSGPKNDSGKKDDAPSKDGNPDPKKAAPAKVYKSPAELFAEMPKDAYPKGGADGTPERKVANEWMKKNRVGHQIEWTHTIGDITISEYSWFNKEKGELERDGTLFSVKFNLKKIDGSPVEHRIAWGEPYSFAGEKCQTLIEAGNQFTYEPVDSATAKKLREFKGKTATIRMTLIDAQFFGPRPDDSGPLTCFLTYFDHFRAGDGVPLANHVTIDGWAPPLLKKK